ncbi:MAG: DUF3822 family protein [Daejeonella sp.]
MNNKEQFSDELYQLNESETKDLLIQLGDHYISYAVINPEQKILHYLARTKVNPELSLQQNLDNLIELNTDLTLKYRKVKICVDTNRFTFIPEDLFDENLIDEYAHFINSDTNSKINVASLGDLAIKNVFAINHELSENLQLRFDKPSVSTSICPFLSACYILLTADPSELFINFNEKSFGAAYFVDGDFIFYNQFEFETQEEFNYYLLNLINQLEIHLATCKVRISGNSDQRAQNKSVIEKYFLEISQPDVNQILQTSSSISSKADLQSYFNLISLSLCE